MPDSQKTIFPISAVILAAGAASRMGQPKLLLPWKGEALIRHAARAALGAGLAEVLVVSGAKTDEVRQALDGLGARLVENPEWANGQSTSVRAGITALAPAARAVIFMLGDQPYVTPALLQTLAETYLRARPLILAPFVGGQRANPVLFDRAVFPELLQLSGDAGARTIFGAHPPQAMAWDDARLLFDVDTPEDYQKLLEDS